MAGEVEAIVAELRAVRRSRRIRMKVLARRIGSAPKTMHNWECGARHPSLRKLTAWAAALGFRIELRA